MINETVMLPGQRGVAFFMALLVAFGICMGGIILCGKLILANSAMSPILLAGLQNTAAAIIIFSMAATKGARLAPPLKDLPFYLISALLGIAIPHAIAFIVVPKIGASIAAMTYLFPAFLTYAMALTVSLDRLDARRIAGLLIGLGGGALIVLGKDGGDISSARGWAALAFLAPLSMAAGNVYRSLYWPKESPIIVFCATILLCAGLSLMLWSLALGDLMIANAFSLAPPQWMALFACIGFTAFGYLAFFDLQRQTGPVYVSQAGYVIAAVGAIGGAIFFNERLPYIVWVGALIVAAGVFIYSRKATPNAPAAADRP